MLRVAGAAMVSAWAVLAPAQPPRVDGTWHATLPGVVSNQNGVQTIESTTTAQLRLLRCGDSVIGTIRRGTSPVSRPLRGAWNGAALTLQGQAPARTIANGQEYELTLLVTYRLRWVRDSLQGTTETQIAEGSPGVTLPGVEQDALPMHAVRVAADTAAPLVCREHAAGERKAQDSTAVLQQLNRMLEAMRQRNADELRAVFHEQVRMTLLRPTANGGRRAAVLTGEQFIAAATNPNGPVLDEPIRNPVVHLDGDLAIVWAEYQVRNATAVSHCGYDAFTFVRADGVWKVIAVADTFRQQGCGPRW